MNYNITFTFFDIQELPVKAQWIINITDSNIEKVLEIKNAPCCIEQQGEEWQIRILSDANNEARTYLEEMAHKRIDTEQIILKITEAEKDYIEGIADDFIQPFIDFPLQKKFKDKDITEGPSKQFQPVDIN